MVITKNSPFSSEEIENLSGEFQTYIKTVIDIQRKVCSAGANRHFENERILLDQNSKQSNLWGGGIDLDTKIIDNNSMINIRSSDSNTSNEIQDPKNRKKFEELTRYFFEELFK